MCKSNEDILRKLQIHVENLTSDPGWVPKLEITGLSQRFLSQSQESQQFVSHGTTSGQPKFLGLELKSRASQKFVSHGALNPMGSQSHRSYLCPTRFSSARIGRARFFSPIGLKKPRPITDWKCEFFPCLDLSSQRTKSKAWISRVGFLSRFPQILSHCFPWSLF